MKEQNEVYEQCKRKTSIPVYTSFDQVIGELVGVALTVIIDITSGCNAKCLYCATGMENRINSQHDYKFLSLKNFQKIYDHLISKGLMCKKSELNLFNWGEPFLNNECIDIYSFLSKKHQTYVLSTNASIYRKAKEQDTYKYCKEIFFSMPGFSQNSYDRIHGFSFEIIKSNIEKIYKDMITHGFEGDAYISAHAYKSSIEELDDLRKWANSLGIKVNAYSPYFVGNSLFVKYFKNEFGDEYKQGICRDLWVDNWKTLQQKRPSDYYCPIIDWIVMDEEGELLLCCSADEDCASYSGWGSIFDINSYEEYREVKEQMLKSETCAECRKWGIDYVVSHNTYY